MPTLGTYSPTHLSGGAGKGTDTIPYDTFCEGV